MADKLALIALNLSSIRTELEYYGKALDLTVDEANRDYGSDFETPVVKAYTSGAIASMIIIKACGFEDELRKHYLANYHHTQTDTVRKSISDLNKLFKNPMLRKLRNYVLAHHNRENQRLLNFDEIQKMIPYQEPEQYYRLIDCCGKVANAISAIPEASR